MDSTYRYQGQFSYTTARSHRHGDLRRIAIGASLIAPQLSISIRDGRYNTIHTLPNTRFDFKARDSPRDLRSRDTWRSDWVDCFRGTARLVRPRNSTAPGEIKMLIFASWGPASVVVEFSIRDDFCQFATRTRPGSSGRWFRSDPPPIQTPPKMPTSLAPPNPQAESHPDDSPTATVTIDAPSTASTDTHDPNDVVFEPTMPVPEPINANFARTDTTL